MDIGRAKQIVESPDEIKVLFQGTPVWIQNLDENDQTARVYTRENPDNEKTVSVGELTEAH